MKEKSTWDKSDGLEREVEKFFDKGGELSSSLAGFEFRRGQLLMARAVSRALSGGHHLMVEAGTGTGKTLAYLLPALLSKRRVVVSTGTINLQEQIIEKDIPLIERALGRTVKAAYLKGRNNYLCRRRYERFFRQRTLGFAGGDDQVAVIERWAKNTGTGDRSELSGLPEDLGLWREIASSPETCIGRKCPHAEACFVNRARKAAQAADIVVVNHYLFFVDLMVRDKTGTGVIPRYEAVVLDEAHGIERICLTYFSLTASPRRTDELVRDLAREMGHERLSAPGIEEAALGVTRASHDFFNKIALKTSEGKVRIERSFFTDDDTNRAAVLTDRLFILRDAIKREAADCESILSAGRRAEEIADDLEFIVTMPDRGYVFWYETKGGEIYLFATPIDITDQLKKALYDKVDTIVFTSATLTVAGTFDFFTRSLGISPDVEGVVIPGGFDLKRQALLFIPPDLPAPAGERLGPAAIDMIRRLLIVSNGRALLLFTSVRNMETAYRALNGVIPVRMMIQGSAPRGELLRIFREDVSSVLFATASFWEGVDVPGESLSLVIIDKLPFDSPADPVIDAKIELLSRREENPFTAYQLPRAVIALRQGLGRLIRSENDRGVLAVLDPRLINRGYGRVFLKSLPPFSITQSYEDTAAFFVGCK